MQMINYFMVLDQLLDTLQREYRSCSLIYRDGEDPCISYTVRCVDAMERFAAAFLTHYQTLHRDELSDIVKAFDYPTWLPPHDPVSTPQFDEMMSVMLDLYDVYVVGVQY